jgi:hypothetical protein
MLSARLFASLFVSALAAAACSVTASSPSSSSSSGGQELSPACALLATCCGRWPDDLRASCTGPASVKGAEGESACKTFLANGTATAYCPELDILNCSDAMRNVMGDQCVGGDGGAGGPVGLASFAASNLGVITPPAGAADVTFDGSMLACDVDTGTGDSACLSGTNKFVAERVGDYDVLYAKSITIADNALVTLEGSRPVILVATDTITVRGYLSIGFTSQSLLDTKPRPGAQSTGPGVGGSYYGGGGFCGKGGGGVDGQGGGASYGTSELVPLVGGSNGSNASGPGAGALELVAGTKIVLDGLVNANGASAYDGGGGSGGGVLVEAPTIEGQGQISANGGDGGKNVNSNDGGGKGGAGATRDGGNATVAYASGGGGAGRIRLNARTQGFKGGLSPSESSTCASKGALTAAP